MNNERIDQILNQMWDEMPFARPLYAQPYIREAMGIYGKEQYKQGCMDQEKVDLFKLGLQLEELSRLRKLVQAQKEYIELLEPDAVFRSNWTEGIELRHKIKSLEQ